MYRKWLRKHNLRTCGGSTWKITIKNYYFLVRLSTMILNPSAPFWLTSYPFNVVLDLANQLEMLAYFFRSTSTDLTRQKNKIKIKYIFLFIGKKILPAVRRGCQIEENRCNTSNVETEATRAKSATVTESPAAHGEDPKNISKNASASWSFFSFSSVFGTPANIHGYYIYIHTYI